MRKISSFSDISTILKHRVDVRDDIGSTVPLFKFLGFKLFKIMEIIENGHWTYEIE